MPMPNEVFHRLLQRPPAGHKYDFGHVLVVGGTPGMVGAPLLTGMAALRVGAGLVTLASTAEVVDKLERRVAELMTLRLSADARELTDFIKARRVSVLVVGPGMPPLFAAKVLSQLSELDLPCVVDGGALSALADNTQLFSRNFILTPHGGEFKRFKTADPGAFARKHQVILVLKGHPTNVFDSSGEKYQNSTGGPALATAGSGDVLAGLIGGIIAQGIEPLAAAEAAVYLHGMAGDLAAEANTVAGVVASDLIESVPAALKLVDKR